MFQKPQTRFFCHSDKGGIRRLLARKSGLLGAVGIGFLVPRNDKKIVCFKNPKPTLPLPMSSLGAKASVA